ncbi:MAG TPA: class I SAM-dependent methyltransferase [Gemmatimonadaceae bacterium]|nr:class I SAM-dependent methyltransferase [Gemmatimonadaceae bacterium]
MNGKDHWNGVYATTRPTDVSWYQGTPVLSLELIQGVGLRPTTEIIDIGGGDSTLADGLLDRGAEHLVVLDLSAVALARAQSRLGARAARVTWIEADVTRAVLPAQTFDVWHDRAVFHFLTDPMDREVYVAQARHAITPGGHLIVATFAADGPTRCSGLDVARYSIDALGDVFADGFDPVTASSEVHQTPTGQAQRFTYCCLRRR